MSLHRPRRADAASIAARLCALLAVAGCEVGTPAGPPQEEDPGALSSQDVRVHECIRRFPRPDYGLGGLDTPDVQERCVAKLGDTSEICDTSRWISLDAAMCVARTAQLDDTHEWRAQLRVSHTFPPSLYYRIRLSEGQDADDERDVDARTGALLWRF